MKRFIQGENRQQATLLPELLDDYIAEDNPVRVIDDFIDALDLGELGFKVEPAETGRPSYNMKRVMQILGVKPFLELIRKWARNLRGNAACIALLRRVQDRISAHLWCGQKLLGGNTARLCGFTLPSARP